MESLTSSLSSAVRRDGGWMQMLFSLWCGTLGRTQINRCALKPRCEEFSREGAVTSWSAGTSSPASGKPKWVMKPQQNLCSNDPVHTAFLFPFHLQCCTNWRDYRLVTALSPQIRPHPPASFMLMTRLKRKSLQPVLRLTDCIDWIKEALFRMKWIFFRQDVQTEAEFTGMVGGGWWGC